MIKIVRDFIAALTIIAYGYLIIMFGYVFFGYIGITPRESFQVNPLGAFFVSSEHI